MFSVTRNSPCQFQENLMVLQRFVGLSILVAWMSMAIPVLAADSEPLAVIKAPIDAVITILNDPHYMTSEAKSAQRKEIWKIVNPMFDFQEISKRAVARHWSDFSDAEKTEFTDVFAQFLGNTYIDKVQGEYHNEQVVYLDQLLHADNYAEVRTQIVRETVEIPVNYRMIKDQAGQWKVYDIIVEGVSLVKNYRTQFADILRKETPAQLIQRLNQKLQEQSKQLVDNA
jgi:phospholipid transport system substrate-binding protein